MDITTVNNAVADAAAGLPSGWTQFVSNNIGSAAGQQAIVQAAANFGITNPSTIASLVNQATGMSVTPAQVQAVAAPTPTPTPTPTPAPSGTSLSNISTPQFVASPASGAVGTSYGQAAPSQVSTAQQANPELSSSLLNGTAAVNYDADTGTYNLINTQTGAPIAGNYQVQVGTNGVGINIPSGNGMIQVAVQPNENGTIPPVTPANVLNVGVNAGAGGFAGGVNTLANAAAPGIALLAGANLLGAVGATDVAGTDLLGQSVGAGAIGSGTADTAIGALGSTAAGNAIAGTDLLGQSVGSGAIGAGTADTAISGLGTAGAGTLIGGGTIGAAGTGTTLADVGAGTAAGTAAGTTAGTAGSTAAGTAAGAGAGAAGGAAGGAASGAAAGAAGGLTAAQIAAGATIGGSLLSQNILNNANTQAGATQAAAGNNALNTIGNFYSQYAAAQQPFQNLGTPAAQDITNNLPYFQNQFNNQDLNAQLAPNYQFQLQQGLGQAQNAANVGGGLLSGNTLQGLNTYAQNYAQGAYQNAFTNYQNQRNNIYNNLAGVAGIGQTSLNQLGSVGANLANTYGNITTGLAASQAGVTTANAQNQANTLQTIAKTAPLLLS